MSKGINTAGVPGFILILVFIFLVLVTAIPTSARAQEQAFTLTDAVRYALEHNNEIRAAGSSLSARKDDVGVARSYLLPKIYFEERALRTNNPTYVFMAKLNQGLFTPQDFAINSLNHPDPYNDFLTQFAAEQPIFVPKAWVGLDMSKREHERRSTRPNRPRNISWG
jgi:outer membrane protein